MDSIIGAGASSVPDFAKRHSISRAQAYIEIRDGRLIARKIGARTVITDEDAAAWRHDLPKMPAGAAQSENTEA